jgi:hypothetical protein
MTSQSWLLADYVMWTQPANSQLIPLGMVKNLVLARLVELADSIWDQNSRISTGSFSPELSQLTPLSGLTPATSPSPIEPAVSLADFVPRV